MLGLHDGSFRTYEQVNPRAFGDPAVLGPSWRRMGVAEDARTRGFPSPSFGGYGFVGLDQAYAF